jgi:hypothetical protein
MCHPRSCNRSATTPRTRATGRFDRAPEPYRHTNGTDDQTAFLHRVARAGDRDRDDRRLPLKGHDEPSLLERQQFTGSAACPFGKDQERIPFAQRRGGALDGGQALLAIAALQRDEPGKVECADQDGQLTQLRLVEHAQPRKQIAQRRVQDRRLHVAGVVHRIHRGTIAKDVLAVDDGHLDAAQPESQTYAAQRDAVKRQRRPRREGQQQKRRPEYNHVK